MPLKSPADDPFVKLARDLGELELVIGARARTVVAEVRAGLADAIAARERGAMPEAVGAIRRAMERLATLGADLDPVEGAMMRFIADRFAGALERGRKGDAKEAVGVMRRNAGDTSDDDKTDW